MRRERSEAVKTVLEINVEGNRGRERPKKRWLDVIKGGVSVDDVRDRA